MGRRATFAARIVCCAAMMILASTQATGTAFARSRGARGWTTNSGLTELPPSCTRSHQSHASSKPRRKSPRPSSPTSTSSPPSLIARFNQIAAYGALFDSRACAVAKAIELGDDDVQVLRYNRPTATLVVVVAEPALATTNTDPPAWVTAIDLSGASTSGGGIWGRNAQSATPLALPTLDLTLQLSGSTARYVCPPSEMVSLANADTPPTAGMATTAQLQAFATSCGRSPAPVPIMPTVGMTLAAFNQIAPGMTYDQVASLAGIPGTLQAESNAAGIDIKIYTWPGVDSGANASITFQDGGEVSKAQSGLG
jgi:hypothetical protein